MMINNSIKEILKKTQTITAFSENTSLKRTYWNEHRKRQSQLSYIIYKMKLHDNVVHATLADNSAVNEF